MFIGFEFQAKQKNAFGNINEAYPIAYKQIFKLKIWKCYRFREYCIRCYDFEGNECMIFTDISIPLVECS